MNCLGLQKFLPPLNPCWFFLPEGMGTYLRDTGTLGWGPGVGLGLSCSWLSPPRFLYTTCGYVTSQFCISAPLDGCCFFDSVIFRLPFNSISDGSVWWLFYILVVILMWVCEEANCVYLCHHLDWKSLDRFWNKGSNKRLKRTQPFHYCILMDRVHW